MSRAVTWGYENRNMVIVVHPHLEEEQLDKHHKGTFKLSRLKYDKKRAKYFFPDHRAEVHVPNKKTYWRKYT